MKAAEWTFLGMGFIAGCLSIVLGGYYLLSTLDDQGAVGGRYTVFGLVASFLFLVLGFGCCGGQWNGVQANLRGIE